MLITVAMQLTCRLKITSRAQTTNRLVGSISSFLALLGSLGEKMVNGSETYNLAIWPLCETEGHIGLHLSAKVP
jgi:hypothetical protein